MPLAYLRLSAPLLEHSAYEKVFVLANVQSLPE
jgi:hypothetical protein